MADRDDIESFWEEIRLPCEPEAPRTWGAVERGTGRIVPLPARIEPLSASVEPLHASMTNFEDPVDEDGSAPSSHPLTENGPAFLGPLNILRGMLRDTPNPAFPVSLLDQLEESLLAGRGVPEGPEFDRFRTPLARSALRLTEAQVQERPNLYQRCQNLARALGDVGLVCEVDPGDNQRIHMLIYDIPNDDLHWGVRWDQGPRPEIGGELRFWVEPPQRDPDED